MASNRVPFVVTASAQVAAPAARLYGIIADYRSGHPRILPPAFTGLTVEAGGVGAGTRILVSMRAFGRALSFRADVSEPHPGRVLVERNMGDPPSVTTFTVEPVDNGSSQVTISTELQVRSGFAGTIERFLTRRFLEPLYAAELAKLGQVAGAAGSQSTA